MIIHESLTFDSLESHLKKPSPCYARQKVNNKLVNNFTPAFIKRNLTLHEVIATMPFAVQSCIIRKN